MNTLLKPSARTWMVLLLATPCLAGTEWVVRPGDNVHFINLSSKPGDTIRFEGVIELDKTLIALRSRTYTGGTVVAPPDNRSHAFMPQRHGGGGFTIEGVTIIGRAVKIEREGGWTDNVTIRNCHIRDLIGGSPDHHSIFITNGAENLLIERNVFENIYGENGILGYGFRNVRIVENRFDRVAEGIHYLSHVGPSDGLYIQRNGFTRIRRMAVEIQGQGDTQNVVVEDNYYADPDMKDADMDSIFALSVVPETARGVVIRRNYIESYERPDGIGCRIGIEVAGNRDGPGPGPLVEENWIRGTNHSIALTTSRDAIVRNNRVEDALMPPSVTVRRWVHNETIENNGPNVKLSWVPETQRQE